MKSRLSLLLSLLLPFSVLGQGLKMVNKVTTYEEGKDTHNSTLYLTPKKLRSNSRTNDGHKSSSIFKKEEQVMYTIDHRNERYTKITEEDIEQMEQMMKRMEDMPESAKEMMGERVKGMMKKDGSKVKYQRTGNTKTVPPWGKCEEWKGTDEEGNMVQKVYTTDRNQVKMRKEHFDIMTDMIEFFDFMPEGMDMNYPVKTKKNRENGLEGFGVLWLYYEDGAKTQRVKVKEMKEQAIKDSRFELPEDYEANEMNMGQSGGRR